MRVGWAEEGFMIDLDKPYVEDGEEQCPELEPEEINAELADLKKQLAEAKALLKEAEPYTVTGGWALYDLSATWEDRRCALLREE